MGSAQVKRVVEPAPQLAVMLLIAVAVAACGGGGANIEERNAKASAALAYDGGEDFVKALEQAGVPCAEKDIGRQGDLLLYWIRCNSGDDLIQAYVADPSPLGRQTYLVYATSSHEAAASTGSEIPALMGQSWYARAPGNLDLLFDIQDALGGQICAPQECATLASDGALLASEPSDAGGATATLAPTRAPWYPADFKPWPEDPYIAFRFMDRAEFDCTDRYAHACWGVLVMSEILECQSVYVQLSILNEDGTVNQGASGSSEGPFATLEQVKVVVNTPLKDPGRARIDYIECEM